MAAACWPAKPQFWCLFWNFWCVSTWISRQPQLRSWTWLCHKKGNFTQNSTVYRAYGNTANFSHRSRSLIITVISTAFVHWIALKPQIHPPNCPFPFDDHHQNLIHRFRARPDSPPQTGIAIHPRVWPQFTPADRQTEVAWRMFSTKSASLYAATR